MATVTDTPTMSRLMDLGQVLSVTQVRCLVTCAAKWYFKYLRRLKETVDGGLALGRAVHSAIERDMKWKFLSKQDPPPEDVQKAFLEAFKAELAGQDFQLRPDESASQLEAMGESLVALWRREIAPTIMPAAIEREVQGEIGGVHVIGRVDLIDTAGTIIDTKTKGTTPSDVDSDQVFQVATYRRLLPQATGKGRIDTLVKLKTPKIVQLEFDVKPADLLHVDTMYPLARDVIRAGLYMPNRSCRICSKKYCSFWRVCEAEFGGEVKE